MFFFKFLLLLPQNTGKILKIQYWKYRKWKIILENIGKFRNTEINSLSSLRYTFYIISSILYKIFKIFIFPIPNLCSNDNFSTKSILYRIQHFTESYNSIFALIISAFSRFNDIFFCILLAGFLGSQKSPESWKSLGIKDFSRNCKIKLHYCTIFTKKLQI